MILMSKLKNYNYYLKIINQIQKIRSKNNLNWMGLLKLSFKHAPKDAIKFVKKIDSQKSILGKLITGTERLQSSLKIIGHSRR